MFLGRVLIWVRILILSRSCQALPVSFAQLTCRRPHEFENLMIIFYDIMLIDDQSILNLSHTRRRRLLKRLITPIPGRAGLAIRDILDFSSPKGPGQLQQALARIFAMRWEGLVLKPCDEPYFNTNKQSFDEYPTCWIKMKKDYIKGLGDTADFAVVGAGYDAAEARKFGGLKLKWTHFHIGCLTNKDEVVHQGAKPSFAVIDALNLCIKPEDIKTLNQLGQFRAVEIASRAEAATYGMNLEQGVPDMVIAFTEPFVFEIMGASFEKQPNHTTFSLRFPRVLKIHWDRDWKEAVTLDELQDMASAAKLVPSDDLAKDVDQWVERLQKVDRGVNGVLAPWENSQDAREEMREPTADQSARTARRGKSKFEAPPMIRMDTREMSQSEYRSESGAVLRKPTSKQSQTSFATESPFSTPPTSSPFRAALDCVAGKHLSAIPTIGAVQDSRKRKIAETESEEVISSDEATQFKRARRFFRAQSGQSETLQLSSSPLAASFRVFQNLSNFARPRETSATKPASRRSGRSKTPDSFLVRKIPLGLSDAAPLQLKSVFQPSSPGRETTASEQTSQGTSQQTAKSETFARPPILSTKDTSPSPTSNKPSFPATASSAQPPSAFHHNTTMPTTTPSPASLSSTPAPIATASPIISLPHLHSTQIYLSPCIAGMPYVTEDLLAARGLVASPFSQNATLPTPTPPSSIRQTPHADKDPVPVVLFVEPKRKDPTVEVLKGLSRRLKDWPKGMRVGVWDWRLLEYIHAGRAGCGTEEGRVRDEEEVKECSYGIVSWDEEKAELAVAWPDGKVSRGNLPD